MINAISGMQFHNIMTKAYLVNARRPTDLLKLDTNVKINKDYYTMYFSIVNIHKLYKINTVSDFKKSLLEYKVL